MVWSVRTCDTPKFSCKAKSAILRILFAAVFAKMDDDMPDASSTSSNLTSATWISTVGCDSALIRGFKRHIGTGRALLLSAQGEIVRVTEGIHDHPQTARTGSQVNVELTPSAQIGLLADGIRMHSRISTQRTNQPHAFYPSVRWVMKAPTDSDWREVHAARLDVVPMEPEWILPDEILDEEYDHSNGSAYPSMHSVLVWIGGVGLSVASGAASVLAMGNKRGFFGAALGLLLYTGWSNFPPEGSPARSAWVGSLNATRQTAENVVYAVQVLPHIINWSFWGVGLVALIWCCNKGRKAVVFTMSASNTKTDAKPIEVAEKKAVETINSGDISATSSTVTPGSRPDSRAASDSGLDSNLRGKMVAKHVSFPWDYRSPRR